MNRTHLVRALAAATTLASAASVSWSQLPCHSAVYLHREGQIGPGESESFRLEVYNASASLLMFDEDSEEWFDTGLDGYTAIGDLCGGRLQLRFTHWSFCPDAPNPILSDPILLEWGAWEPQLTMRTIPERPVEGEEFQIVASIPNLPTYSWGLGQLVRLERSDDGGTTWYGTGRAGPIFWPGRDEVVTGTEYVGFPGHIVRLRLDLCGNTYYTQPSQQPVKWVPQLEMRTNPERPLPGEEFQVLGRIPNLPTYSFGVQTYVRYETSRDGGATWVNLGSGFSAFPSRDWQVLRTDRMDVDGFMVRLSMTLAGTTYSTPPSQQPLPFEPQIQIWSLPDVPVANQALTLFVRLANRPTFGLGSVIHRIEQSDDRGQTWTAPGWTSADAVPPNPPGEYRIAPEQAVPGRWFRATMPRYSFGNFEGTSAVVEIPELCPADFDGSGFADADDFVFYLAQFSLGCDGVGSPESACAKSADFDRSGFVDSDDFVGYLAAFQAGCP